MKEVQVLARVGGYVSVVSELGVLPPQFVGDGRHSRKNRAYLATKAARHLVQEIDERTFGVADARWFAASMPPATYWKRISDIAEEIMMQ